MNKMKLLTLAASLALIAGCATTDTQERDAEEERLRAEREAAEAGGVGRAERMESDPLEDPSNQLADRVVYFEFDRSDIPSQHLNTLDAHARHLIENPNLRIRLEGHADDRGSREYNIGLGDRRAQAVRRILLFQGVANDQVSTLSYGEERPAVRGSGEDVWAKNRRVEIVYLR